MRNNHKVSGRLLVVACAGAFLVLTGCASTSTESNRLARYRPKTSDRNIWRWSGSDGSARSASIGEEAPLDNVLKKAALLGHSERKILKRGDKIEVHLVGIPNAYNIVDVIDDLGNINLPLIETITIAGKTTSEAEKDIENAYVNGGYYRKISVTVVAEMDEYFMRGEIRQSGRYMLASDLTLLQAIATAGGYTDYAKRSEVRIIRNDEILVFNATKIESGVEKDTFVNSGDIIIIPRRRW